MAVGELEVLQCDLASFTQIRAFAANLQVTFDICRSDCVPFWQWFARYICRAADLLRLQHR
jgi:hypothetical protein